MKDKYLDYLERYYEEHGDINNIPRDFIVEIEGEILQVGEFFATIRRQHRLYTRGKTNRGCTSPLTLSRYERLDKMSFIWEPATERRKQLELSDPILDYVTAYYDDKKTFEGLPEEVEINGQVYSIKNFFSHIRTHHKNWLNGTNKKGSNSENTLRRYAALEKRNFDWEPKLRKARIQEEDDKYIRYLQSYYQEHQTLEGVPKLVTFEGVELNIMSFLDDRRKKRRKKELNPAYNPSSLEQKRWEQLDEMHYDWNFFEKRKKDMLENDPYIRYLKTYYSTPGSINSISPREEVMFEGQLLKIGVFVNDYRKKHYIYTTKETKPKSVMSPLALKRYKELEALGIDWRPSETQFSAAKHAAVHGVKARTLKKYITKFNGDIDKATKFCVAARKHNKQVKSTSQSKKITLNTVMKEFDIDINTLVSHLTRPSLQTRTNLNPTLMYDENTNLHQFCLANGLNYRVIQKAISLRQKGLVDEDLQSLINRTVCEFKVHGQDKPSTWIYSKYGQEVLVRHLLISMHLDPHAVLRDMTKNALTLEEAIENDSFRRNSSEQDIYLEPIYHELIAFYNKVNTSREYTPETAPAAIIEYFQGLITEYKLTQEEFDCIRKSFVQYSESIERYKLYNVGFEKDPEVRVQKIIDYMLDDEEIEEAFFMPLQFDKKVLIGRESEIYERRMLLRNLTTKWNEIPEELHSEISSHYHLTEEELSYITTTRKEIDTTIAKVHIKK